MGKFVCKDITNVRFGKLVAICKTTETDKKGCYKWLCQCDCGNVAIVSIDNLRLTGGTKSCGCERRNKVVKPLHEYEADKRKELSLLTDQWKYVRCYDRDKSKHVVKCVVCNTEKIVIGIGNISPCATCKKMQKKHDEEQRKHKVCVVCGSSFKPKRSTALYCCERCSKVAYKLRNIESVRERNRINKRLRESKATSNGKVDYSITLSKLIERDKHICQLCNREVNETDFTFVGDVFIAGNDYPSIDHIKPLSKGGVHQWNNVQLAHRWCNSIKNNKETF